MRGRRRTRRWPRSRALFRTQVALPCLELLEKRRRPLASACSAGASVSPRSIDCYALHPTHPITLRNSQTVTTGAMNAHRDKRGISHRLRSLNGHGGGGQRPPPSPPTSPATPPGPYRQLPSSVASPP